MCLAIPGIAQRTVSLLADFGALPPTELNTEGHTERNTAVITALATNYKRKGKTRTVAANARTLQTVGPNAVHLRYLCPN